MLRTEGFELNASTKFFEPSTLISLKKCEHTDASVEKSEEERDKEAFLSLSSLSKWSSLKRCVHRSNGEEEVSMK